MAGEYIVLACKYAKGRYPKLGLVFRNGRATVTKDFFDQKVKKHRLYMVDFGEISKFLNANSGANVKVTAREQTSETPMNRPVVPSLPDINEGDQT